ncbi:sigma-70 family RNA polymerase sigma factor [Bacillus sp. AFS041924]|uniref:sigma-70 family RNA polymerase sigma factor n=1 Tax=Bacillus sp. AFS041924 TaxID=2033503 RepID=UPI000BFDC5F8|nr:sigma-70 family RNA polymerase sigma factor [Bacillus sp. AFS041924]PGS52640.1 RNA polymerase subunit sigma-70 [Bacillus sp. AFS041924]
MNRSEEHVNFQTFSGKTKPNTFEECLNQYSRMIKNLMKKLHIYKDFDEYYQIGQIALWMAYQQYRSEKGNFSSYAFFTVRGYLLNELSKAIKYDEHNVVVEQNIKDVIYCDESFQIEDFVSLLEGISPLQKRILIRRFYYNHEFYQIANCLKMYESSVRSSYRYALKRLRESK